MNIPDIIKNENDNIYISVRNYMEYSIDDSIETDDIIIDLHNQNDHWLLVGIEIIKDENIKLGNIRYLTDDHVCYVKFNNCKIEDNLIISEIIRPYIEIYKNNNGEINSIIIRRNYINNMDMDIEEEIMKMKITN